MVNACAISPDGAFVVAASGKGICCEIPSAWSGQQLAGLEGHSCNLLILELRREPSPRPQLAAVTEAAVPAEQPALLALLCAHCSFLVSPSDLLCPRCGLDIRSRTSQ
jgi:hypothetical protein